MMRRLQVRAETDEARSILSGSFDKLPIAPRMSLRSSLAEIGDDESTTTET
jgi:hypothetical protein